MLLMTGCASTKIEPPPYVPPKYLGAIELMLWQVLDAYLGTYGDFYLVSSILDKKTVVFKNIEIKQEMLVAKHKGYLWLDFIQCQPADLADLDALRKGQIVDIAGICHAPPYSGLGIVLTDCIFLPAGVADLTVGAPGIDIPAY